MCADSDSNRFEFIPDVAVEERCKTDNPLALGCVPAGTSNILLRNKPLRRVPSTGQIEPTRWDVMDNGCSYMHRVVVHEAGHILSLSHSLTPQSVMYPSLSGWIKPFCKPQVYDVVGMIVNYQSR